MRYLLTVVLFLLATPCFAVLTRTYTIKESGGDYTSLASAEVAHEQDYVANDSALTFEISGTWTSSTSSVTYDGSVCDGTRFPTIIAVGDARATGTWSTTAFRIVSSNAPITPLDNDITFDGIQCHLTITGGSFTGVISGNSTGRQIIQNCVLKANKTGANTRIIFMNNAGLDNCIVRNNVIYDCNQQAIFFSGADGGCLIDNNTIENVNLGIVSGGDEDVIARNNIVVNATTPFSGNFNTTTLSEENYTDDGSISYGSCGSCGAGDQVSQSADPFVDMAGENYHLAAGATAIDAGKDLSGDFTTDIDGDTRDSNFDKGADEFIAVSTGQKVMIRK